MHTTLLLCVFAPFGSFRAVTLPIIGQCLEEASKLVLGDDNELHTYGDGLGLLELRERLKEKLRVENGIVGKEVMITAVSSTYYSAKYLCDVCMILDHMSQILNQPQTNTRSYCAYFRV
jgi:hypothetical protein